jgi:hypothetical protein
VKIDAITIGARSDGRVVMTLAAIDDQGQPCETTFDMPDSMADLTADDLKAMAERARARLAIIAATAAAEKK